MAVSELKIKKFLEDGCGYCHGCGHGNGCGYCHGCGHGNGCGYGNGDGNGNGDDCGEGIKCINGLTVYSVDDTPTVFTSIHGSVAKGAILGVGLKLTPCYVVKGSGYFAHGETLSEANAALESKIISNMDVEERVAEFNKKFKPGIKYPVRDFYEWHNKLTGSCEMGRREFARNHGIDIDHDEMTVAEFVELTNDAYGGDVIKMIAGGQKDAL